MKQRFLALILLITTYSYASNPFLFVGDAAAGTFEGSPLPNDRLNEVVRREKRAARAALWAAAQPRTPTNRNFPEKPRNGKRDQLTRKTGDKKTKSRKANRKA